MADQAKPQPQHVQLTLNKDGVVAPAHTVAHQCVNIVNFCMNAIAVGDFSKDPEWEGGFFKMVVKGPEVSSEQRRRQLQNWILSKAFQDLARGVRAMLEEAYLYVGVV